jgi:chaperonin GroEL (HSP60 family)
VLANHSLSKDMPSTALLLVKVTDSQCTQSIVYLTSTAMKTRIPNAKIACLDINLQKSRMHLGVQILIDDPNQLEEIRKR